MTKYQDLKNEVKRFWKLKNAKVVPVIFGATGMTKNLCDINNHPWEYHYKLDIKAERPLGISTSFMAYPETNF